MTNRRTLRRVLAAAGLAVALTAGAACSSSDDASTTATTTATEQYCVAWSDLVSAFGAYDQVDVVNQGLDSVRTYVDQIEAAATDLASASDTLIGPKVDAFSASMDDLVTALTDPGLPVDRVQQVRDAKAEVDTAWNDMVATFKTQCPDVKASTV